MVAYSIRQQEPASSTRSSAGLFAGAGGLPRDGPEGYCTRVSSTLADGSDSFTADLCDDFPGGLCNGSKDGSEEFPDGFPYSFCKRGSKQSADTADSHYQ